MKEMCFITNGHRVQQTNAKTFKERPELFKGWRVAQPDEVIAAGYNITVTEPVETKPEPEPEPIAVAETDPIDKKTETNEEAKVQEVGKKTETKKQKKELEAKDEPKA